MVLPSRVTGGSPALIESGTCSGLLWVTSAIPQLSSYVFQVSVCSDADVSRLGIPSSRQAVGRENGVFLSGLRDESLFLPESDLFFKTQGHGVISSLSCVSCRSPSKALGVAMTLEGFLGILVILLEMHGRWQFQFDFLGGVFRAERISSFIWRNLYFFEGILGASSGVSG